MKVIDGNIFNVNSEVLVNTVNCDGFMGKGIALEFKLRFCNMFYEYQELCEKNLLRPGKLFFYNKEKPKVLCFPTKNSYKLPSKIEYLKSGLLSFLENYKKYNVKSVALPLLGASNGKINSDISLSIMREYLENLPDIDITIVKTYIPSKDPILKSFLDYVNNHGSLDGIGAAAHLRLVEIIKDNYEKINSLTDLLYIKQDVQFNDGSFRRVGVSEETIMKAFDSFKDKKSQPSQLSIYDYN